MLGRDDHFARSYMIGSTDLGTGRDARSSKSELGRRPLPGNRFVSFVRAHARCPLPSGNELKR